MAQPYLSQMSPGLSVSSGHMSVQYLHKTAHDFALFSIFFNLPRSPHLTVRFPAVFCSLFSLTPAPHHLSPLPWVSPNDRKKTEGQGRGSRKSKGATRPVTEDV